MQHEYNKNLLAEFDIATQDLQRENNRFFHIGNDIFLWKNNDQTIKKYDLIINCCTHGNEVIGLCIVNNLLKHIKHHTINTNLNIVFSLGNREAVLVNKRFVEKDLNRSFSKTSSVLSREEKRAQELENMAKDATAILDIHQTTSDSMSPFFVMKEIPYNYNFFEILDINIWPMILYKEGKFSKDGEAYSSFAMHNQIPFITIELGLSGPNNELEKYFFLKIKELLEKYKSNVWQSLFTKTDWKKPSIPCYREYRNIERLSDDDYLIDGLKNLSLIEQNTIYAYQNTIALKESSDVYALFPKYGIFRKTSSELVRLLKKGCF